MSKESDNFFHRDNRKNEVILDQNRRLNGGVLKDDVTGETLDEPVQAKKV